MLPDDALLAIFDFCGNENDTTEELIAWETLVHVCRRWRSLVFESPRRLNLQLVCTSGTPARDTLDIWPTLPLVVRYEGDCPMDNIVAALEHRNRVRQIELFNLPILSLEKSWAAMQMAFPELKDLVLVSDGKKALPILPDSVLGGSAPSLRRLWLAGIPFPGLPKLLLSATRLVDLTLWSIPHFGYFSPEDILTALSKLTSLEELRLEFRSFLSRPYQESRPPPPTRVILPTLRHFSFIGASEYLDDLLARIDSPQLIKLYITFFNQIIFGTPQFVQFINCTSTLKPLKEACLVLGDDYARVRLSSHAPPFQELDVKVPCRELHWQVSSLGQVCNSCLPLFSTLEELYIYGDPFCKINSQDNIENSLWLDLLQPFTAVKKLYLAKEFVPGIVPALQELVEDRTIEVLPTLESIFLEGLQTPGRVPEGIRQFIATRQASRPIAVFPWGVRSKIF